MKKLSEIKVCVGVTSCATGIAHTYMAADAIKKACKKRGIKVKVETQGAIGVENELKQSEIDMADLQEDRALRGQGRHPLLLPPRRRHRQARPDLQQVRRVARTRSRYQAFL